MAQVAQPVVLPPPQSTSVSPLSLMPSLHCESTHLSVSLLQNVLVQSPPDLQTWFRPQCAQVGPPQSTSLSLPSTAPSWHWSATHTLVVWLQNMLRQSRGPLMQPCVSAQPGQVPPPQSLSVSLPSLAPSMHCVATQTLPALQVPLAQSLPLLQDAPTLQVLPQEPPQSTSVSVPFLRPSWHWSATQVRLTALQKWLMQSLLLRQALLIPQPGQVVP